MFTTGFRTRVTPRMRDILRAHLFPEVTVKQNSQIKIMDIQQEILARNIGDGHRVIHGVAGSGKTMILLFRCLYWLKPRPERFWCCATTLLWPVICGNALMSEG